MMLKSSTFDNVIDPSRIAAYFPALENDLAEEIAATGVVKTFEKGEILVRSGQYIRSMMLILEGLVKVYREDEEGDEYFMYYLESGHACALSLLCSFKQDTSELSARAVQRTTVIIIPLKHMEEWMNRYKSWYQFVLATYRERFEELLRTIDHIAFRNMDERLAFYLKRHQEKLQTNILPLTHTEIARELNSSREVITRLLKKLAEKGMVKLHRQHIEVVKLPVE